MSHCSTTVTCYITKIVMRKKFTILYPQDHPDTEKRGKKYKPGKKSMVVVNQSGIFFEYCNEEYYPYINKLSDLLPKYDVVWQE